MFNDKIKFPKRKKEAAVDSVETNEIIAVSEETAEEIINLAKESDSCEDLYEVSAEVVEELVDSEDEEPAAEVEVEYAEAEEITETEEVSETEETVVVENSDDAEEVAIIEEVAESVLEDKNTKKAKKTKKNKDKAKKNGKQIKLFSIRNKIFASFIVPIAFMVLVGLVSYKYAASGMNNNFVESTEQTAKMAVDYLDVNFQSIQGDGMSYAFDANLDPYFLGTIKEKFKKANENKNIRVNLMAAQSANSFIQNIHLVAKPGIDSITTATDEKIDGIMTDYVEEMTTAKGLRVMDKWVDSHPSLDANLNLNGDDYFMAFQNISNKKDFVVVIDLKNEGVKELVNGLDFGEGSSIAFITPSGKQVLSDTSSNIDFTSFDFYKNISTEDGAEEANVGSGDVVIDGKDYLYIYSRSAVSGVTLCSVIPQSVVTAQAESIKTITVVLVLVAMIVALLIGLFVTYGIQKNLRGISAKMDEVANGDLTVEVKASGHDEFQSLASTATNMISNNRKLVGSLTRTANQLENTVGSVYDVSSDINTYSEDITNAIDEIGVGMDRQSLHAEECIEKTNTLSEKIGSISEMIDDTTKLAGETENKISEGKGIVEMLIERAERTSQITDEVSDSVINFKAESQVITGFADTIQEISDQTNLLSLNASIEAARAGEAGRGFSVVAEEIRKLADQSAGAAVEIKKQVESIVLKTDETVKTADMAKEMVKEESEFVDKVSALFDEMNGQMVMLFDRLKNVAENAEATSADREATLDAVESISAIIEQTSASSQLVRSMAEKLHTNVERLTETAGTLDEDMNSLKDEITVFKLD